MANLFQKWINKKIELHARLNTPSFKIKEVFWCAMGENVGDEENGKSELFSRPVLVMRKFNSNLFWGLPLTTQNKQNPYYLKISFIGREQSVIITQLRLMDAKRLYGQAIGKISSSDFEKVRQAIKNLL